MKARSAAWRCGATRPFDCGAVFGQVSGKDASASKWRLRADISRGPAAAALVTHQHQHEACDTFYAIYYANCNGFFVGLAEPA